MTKIKLSKREMMVKAHQLAKQMVGDYIARLTLALRTLWAAAKKGASKMGKMPEVKKYFTAMMTGPVGDQVMTRGNEYEVISEDKFAQTVKFIGENGKETTLNYSGIMAVKGKKVYFKPVN